MNQTIKKVSRYPKISVIENKGSFEESLLNTSPHSIYATIFYTPYIVMLL